MEPTNCYKISVTMETAEDSAKNQHAPMQACFFLKGFRVVTTWALQHSTTIVDTQHRGHGTDTG